MVSVPPPSHPYFVGVVYIYFLLLLILSEMGVGGWLGVSHHIFFSRNLYVIVCS